MTANFLSLYAFLSSLSTSFWMSLQIFSFSASVSFFSRKAGLFLCCCSCMSVHLFFSVKVDLICRCFLQTMLSVLHLIQFWYEKHSNLASNNKPVKLLLQRLMVKCLFGALKAAVSGAVVYCCIVTAWHLCDIQLISTLSTFPCDLASREM